MSRDGSLGRSTGLKSLGQYSEAVLHSTTVLATGNRQGAEDKIDDLGGASGDRI